MALRVCSAYVDLRHVVRTWTSMLSPCLYSYFCPVHAFLRVQHPPLETAGGVCVTDYVPGAYRTDTYEHQDLGTSPAFTPMHVLLCE